MAVESVLYENMDSSPKPWGWLSSICEKNKWRGRAEERIAEKGRKLGDSSIEKKTESKWMWVYSRINVRKRRYTSFPKTVSMILTKLRVLGDKTFCIHAFKKISHPSPNFKWRLLFYLWVLWGHRRISNWLNIAHWRFYFADKYLMINWCKLFHSLEPPLIQWGSDSEIGHLVSNYMSLVKGHQLYSVW